MHTSNAVLTEDFQTPSKSRSAENAANAAASYLSFVRPVVLTIPEFCARYKVGNTKAFALMKNGEVTRVKHGHKTLILFESAEQWFASLPRG